MQSDNSSTCVWHTWSPPRRRPGGQRSYRNSLRIEGDTAHLRLGPPEHDWWVAIDLADLDLVRRDPCTWYGAQSSSGSVYASTRTKSGRKRLSLHRLLLSPPDDLVVDHIDGNTLNCRRSNLRIVTRAQNMQNRHGADRDSHSGVRGLDFIRRPNGRRYWQARVAVDGKNSQRIFPFTDDGKNAAAAWVQQRRRELMPYSTADQVS